MLKSLKVIVFLGFLGALSAQETKVIRYSVPAARGNILLFSETNRRFYPIATSQEVQYLSINFEDILKSEKKEDVFKYTREAMAWINRVRGEFNPYRKQFGLPELGPDNLTDHEIWEYYYARRWIPMRVSSVLLDKELEFLKTKGWPIPVQLFKRRVRSYPEHQMAQHVLGRFSKASVYDWARDGAIEESQFLYPKQKAGMIEVDVNGVKQKKRVGTGIESSLAELLDSGKPQIVEKTFTHTPNGVSVSEKTIQEDVPGASVVLTMDYDLQKIAEELVHDQYLKKIGKKQYSINTKAKKLPKAFILIDLKDMSIAAMASSPSFDLQRFSPGFGGDDYEGKLRAEKNSSGAELKPLDSRAFEMSYPPASTFKLITVLAGLDTATISRSTKFQCTPSYRVGNRDFDNHVDEKEALGLSEDPFYNYSQAIKRSCNTWFYQMALEMSKDPQKLQRFFDIAKLFGFGVQPEVPLPGLATGAMYSDINAIKNDDGTTRKGLYPGEVANMSIGQGPILASPLQVAWMSARLARPDSDQKLKIVKEIYYDTSKPPQKYEDYLASQGKSLKIDPINKHISQFNIALIQNAMHSVVNDENGTASRVNTGLSYPGLGPAVAAKTGTGQWGDNNRVVWLTGFFPFHAPRYAFTVFVEGKKGLVLSGGADAAPYLNAFLSDEIVRRKLVDHVENTPVLIPRMVDLEDEEPQPRVLRAIPVFEEPQENSRYLREENPEQFREETRKRKPLWRRILGINEEASR